MPGNTIGERFRLTTFGESHGPSIGGVLDGMPAGVRIDPERLQAELHRRRPGQSNLTTARKEADQVTLLSGVFEGRTTGTPIGFTIPNSDAKPEDYGHLESQYRPSHADYTYDAKYGFRDYRGGGRASARETASRVVAGALARQFLEQLYPKGPFPEVSAYVERVQDIAMPTPPAFFAQETVDAHAVRCPDTDTARRMEARILEVKKAGDTVGGSVVVVAKGVPPTWGEPVFDKLQADLAKAIWSLPAVKGLELGSGFSGTLMRGSEHNDAFTGKSGNIRTTTNHSGGIQGGISNGEDIVLRVGFKPVATLLTEQASVNQAGEDVVLSGRGRHDPCVLPRAVPMVEAMVLLVLADHALRQRSARL
ncbi:MAG: chorismate synthase [Flavobacteriales bacterium]|nr:chorismate synthase [Flavobacteriales bacterium]